ASSLDTSDRLLASPLTADIIRCFFFTDTATTEIYTLSLHDALPISYAVLLRRGVPMVRKPFQMGVRVEHPQETVNRVQYGLADRSEEHTSELQSLTNLVCRLLLEKKNKRAERP